MMDFTEFPAPYDVELPYYIGKAREQLSLTGNALLNHVLEPPETLEPPGAWFWNALKRLPQQDRDIVLAINKHLMAAYAARADKNQGEADLHRQVGTLFSRAQELEPDLRAKGDNVTLGEAVEVLKRHGEPLGISEEVLEMIVEVPETDE